MVVSQGVETRTNGVAPSGLWLMMKGPACVGVVSCTTDHVDTLRAIRCISSWTLRRVSGSSAAVAVKMTSEARCVFTMSRGVGS